MARSAPDSMVVAAGDCHLEIDFAAHAVRANGEDIPLTPTEYEVLLCLAARTRTVVPLDDLIEAVWGDWFGPRGHVSVHVHHLRRKLGTCGALIVTRRGVGYMLASDDPATSQSPSPGWGTESLFELLQVDGAARSVVWLLIDSDRTIEWISASIFALTGWRPEELIGHVPWEFTDEAGAEVRLLIDHGASGMLQPAFPVYLRRPDGTMAEIAVAVRVFRDSAGSYLGALTEWRPVDDVAPQAAFTLHFDAESTLVAVEPHAPFLGWDPEEVLGSYFSLAGIDQEMSSAALVSMVASGVAEQEVAVPAVGKDGTITRVMATLRLDVADGRLRGYSGAIRLA